MQLRSAFFTVVLIVLWYLSAFYIAAPHDVHNLLFGGFGMTHQQHQLLGVVLFIVSLFVVLVWAISQKDEKESQEIRA